MKYRLHCLPLALLALFASVAGMGGTYLEDKMETEIDLRSPREFAALDSSKILSVRQVPFGKIYMNKSGEISSRDVNSQMFTVNYWYETRDKSALCPQTPIAIATEVDWALQVPCLFTGPNPHVSPRSIYVYTPMLPHFAESTLKFMDPNHRFVLLSGGIDSTIPRNWFTDRALRGFSADPNSYWFQILNDPRVIHWFAENHDMNHPKMSTLPCGFVMGDRKNPGLKLHVDDYSDHPKPSEIKNITSRPLKFVVSDKVRSGTGIWEDRQYAIDKCLEHKQFCYFPQQNYSRDTGLTHTDFVHLMARFPFTACVHGAGIEPSPKAWEAVLVGSIPIVQHSVLDDAYERLPIVFVHDWKDLFENKDIGGLLQRWLDQLAPYYEEGSALRKMARSRLDMKYWLDQVEHKYQHHMDGEMRNLHHRIRNITLAAGGTSAGGAMRNVGRRLMDADGLPRRLAIEFDD